MAVVRFILRSIHILGGVFWVGSVFAVIMAVVPAMRSGGPDGGTAIRSVAPRLFRLGSIAGLITVLSGVLMYTFAVINLQTAWLTSGAGISISIGALAGLIAFIYAGAVLRPTNKRLGALNREMAAAGGEPDPGMAAEIASLGRRQTASARIFFILLILSTLGMAASDVFMP